MMKALIAKYRFARNVLGLPIKKAIKAVLNPQFIQFDGNIFLDEGEDE